MRRCDGTDPNLTREYTADSPDLASIDGATISPWDRAAKPGTVVTQCRCGLVFDDAQRSVIWPHELL